ncbi:MAG: hypothetical protein U0869_03610 [Chloroflexota bacterium]
MSTTQADDEMESEYDFRGGVRGKYFDAYHAEPVTIVIEPDPAAEVSARESREETREAATYPKDGLPARRR